MISFVLVGLGGFVGAVLRYSLMLGVGAMSWHGAWATLSVNTLGSLAVGCLAPHFTQPGHPVRLFVIIGLLGGFTTFSAFSEQTLHLLHQGEWALAVGNIFLNMSLCLFFVWVGFKLSRTYL